MTFWTITGDRTEDRDEAIHCAACKRALNLEEAFDGLECGCGAELTGPESVMTGRQIKEAVQRTEREIEEWNRLNGRSP